MQLLISSVHPETTQKEIKELSNISSKLLLENKLLCNLNSFQDIADLIYNLRSATSAMILLTHTTFETLEDIKKITFDPTSYLKESFAIRCTRKGDHRFTSKDVEQTLAEKVNAKVDLENPQTVIKVEILDNNCFIGIDVIGFKLARRDYRVKVLSVSLNPCLAYSILRIIDWKPTESLLDPFSKEGTLPIEAALYRKNISPFINEKNKFLINNLSSIEFKDQENNSNLNIHLLTDSFPFMKNAEVNAKLAGVKKDINFSKNSLDWLDTKFEENSIDKIVSFLQFSRQDNKKELIKEFFYQAKYILKDKGMVLVKDKSLVKKYCEEFQFKIFLEDLIYSNGQDYWLIGFQK